MKKLLKALFSVLFATTMVLPVEALANPVQEFDEIVEECEAQPSESDNYSLTFLKGDFSSQLAKIDTKDQPEYLVIFISDPDRKIVKNAQVVTTIIDQNGSQMMRRARAFKGGYLIDTGQLTSGQYRVEAEIVTNGWLLTDEFNLQQT